jgi:hypothetical protein
MHTLKTIRKTNNSYNKAIQEINTLLGGGVILDRYGSGYSHYISDSYTVSNSSHNNIKFSNTVHINIQSLFEFDRPKIIEEGSWIYKCDYIRIKFYIDVEYYNYHLDANRIKSDKQKLTFLIYEFTSGLKNYEENKNKLLLYIKYCNENIKTKINERLNNADKEIGSWKKAIKKITKIHL